MTAVESARGIWRHVQEKQEAARDGEVSLDIWNRLAELTDPAEFRPKLADDIERRDVHLRWNNDYTVVANPRDLLHIKLEPEAAELLELMDGTRTLKEIVIERFQESGDLELSGVADVVELLKTNNFLDKPFVDVPAAVERAMQPVSQRRKKARHFAKTLSIEWTGADRLVRWLYHHGFKYFFNKAAVLLCSLLGAAGVAAFIVVMREGRFALAGESLAIGFVLLFVLDLLSVFFHELAHALVLTRNGRKVKSAGFLIYFGSPAFFVESSEVLMLSRRQNMLQSFVGPFAQFVVGGVCALIIWAVPEWILSPTLYKVAVLNYFMVFMNLIPMLELDGYWLLTDAIEYPDLRPRSLSFLRHELIHKLRTRQKWLKTEVGLAVYAILGVVFTVFSFYTSYFYWRNVFGSLVTRLWTGGVVTRFLLILLVMFVAGPLIRGLISLARSVARRLRLGWRRIRFALEQKWRVEAALLIDALPLFDDVPEEVLNDLAGRVQVRSFSPGQAVVRQGEPAGGFYVVRRGTLQVVEQTPDTGAERTLRVLGRGEAFGEVGLKEGAVRSATVRAVDEAEVFEIDKSTFDRLLADMVRVPDFAPTFQHVHELKGIRAFARLEADELAQVLEHGEWVKVTPGEYIIEQGAIGDSFYGIGSGQADVFEDGDLKATLGPGAYFGEVALLLSVPRTATVVAKTPMRVFKLDREGFDRLIADAFKKGTLNPNASLDRVDQH